MASILSASTVNCPARPSVEELSPMRRPALSTSGGTSDGRFLAPLGAQVVEIGPVNATIHQVDERVLIADLERLSRVYERLLEKLL